MKIRDLEAGEEPILWDLFYSTIHHVNARDYSPAQLDAWAPREIDSEAWVAKMQSIRPFVVDFDGEIAGYSDLQPDGLIDHLFVHHRWQRRGVGRRLMEEILRRAGKRQLTQLETHASITARPFFEAFGFVVIQEQLVERSGETLRNYRMHRTLAEARIHSPGADC